MPIKNRLCEILDDYGHDLAEDHKRLKGILKDLCHLHIMEVNILILVAEHGVVTRLKSHTASCPIQIVFAKCQAHVERTLGLDPGKAKWAVETWAAAIGVHPPRSIPKPKYDLLKRDKPKPPAAPAPAHSAKPPSPPQAAAPFLHPSGGRYKGEVEISMLCTEPTAVIHYSEDGIDPSPTTPKYEKPLIRTNPVTIKARAYSPAMPPSDIVEVAYNITHTGTGKTHTVTTPLAAVFQPQASQPDQNPPSASVQRTLHLNPLFQEVSTDQTNQGSGTPEPEEGPQKAPRKGHTSATVSAIFTSDKVERPARQDPNPNNPPREGDAHIGRKPPEPTRDDEPKQPKKPAHSVKKGLGGAFS